MGLLRVRRAISTATTVIETHGWTIRRSRSISLTFICALPLSAQVTRLSNGLAMTPTGPNNYKPEEGCSERNDGDDNRETASASPVLANALDLCNSIVAKPGVGGGHIAISAAAARAELDE